MLNHFNFRTNKDPIRHNVADFPSGAALTGIAIVQAAWLEETSGYRMNELFTGGFIGKSAGAFPACAAAFGMISMADMQKQFFENLPKFIPNDPLHYRKQIMHHVLDKLPTRAKREWKNLRGELKIHYDRTEMEQTTKTIFGDRTLSDAQRSLLITSQSICTDRQEPYYFFHITEDLLAKDAKLARQNPDAPPIPAYKAIMAATAFPTVFDAYRLEETGRLHVDAALVDGSAEHIIKLDRNLPPGHSLELVCFSAGDFNTPLTAEEYSRMGCLEMLDNRQYFNSLGAQAQIQDRQTIRAYLGEDHVHHMPIPISSKRNTSENDSSPSANPIDTSPEQIDRLINHTRDVIKSREDQYMRLAERLVENMQAVNKLTNPGFSNLGFFRHLRL